MTVKTFWVGMSCCLLTCGMLQAQQPAKLNAADKQFLKMAADGNMMEAHAGQMAEAQASSESVKDFGKTLEQDHTKAYNELAAVADKAGESIPKGINVSHDKPMEQLMHLKGKAFDRSFVRHEIQDHQKTIAAFEREAKQGQNPDLMSYAQQSLPVLQKHLQMAQMLAKSEKPS